MYSCRLMCIPARIAYSAIATSTAYIFYTANNCTEFETPALQHEPCQQQRKSSSRSTKQKERINKDASLSPSSSSSSSAEINQTLASSIVTTWNDSRTSLSISVNSPVKRYRQQQEQQQQENTMENSQQDELNVQKELTREIPKNAQSEHTCCGNNYWNINNSNIVTNETRSEDDRLNGISNRENEMSIPDAARYDVEKVSKSSHEHCNNNSGNSTTNKSTNTSTPCNFMQCTNLQEPFTEPIKRIILIRNGLSEANVDVSKYVSTPDWRIPIVEEGKVQAIKAGRALATLIDNDPIYFYYSPYIRSRQSLRYILQGMSEQKNATDKEQQEESVSCHELESNAIKDNKESCKANENNYLFDNEKSWCDVANHECNLNCHTWLSGNDTARENLFEACELSNELLHSECKLPENTSSEAPSSPLHSPCSSLSDAEHTLDANRHEESKCELQKQSSLEADKCRSTASLLLSPSFDNIVGVREDVRLRDGDIGRYQSMDELIYHLEERERYGQFFYRFPHGESGADVCDRVTSFLDAFQRERVMMPMNTNVVIVTHGLAIRMFIARWFHLTVDTFHRMRSPPPGAICTLTRICHQSRFRLNEECLESMRLPVSLNDKNGYKYRNKQLLGSLSSGAPYM